MTHSIHHSEENRVRSYAVQRLSMRSLFIATAITTGLAYLVCALFLTVAPDATMAFFSYILHANLNGIVRSLTWGSFIVGFLVWSVGTGLYAALIARLYNKFSVK